MSAQLLIYETAVPVSANRHGDCSLQAGSDYRFTNSINSVPLLAMEFPGAAAEYAIVFVGSDDAVVPVAVLGMRQGENLYLSPEGAWHAKYVPAFLRRYPFVFSRSEDRKTFTLCVDEAFPGLNRDGQGQRLFGDDRKPTEYLSNVLKFLEQYQMQFRRTQAFCNRLRELDLLEPMRAQASLQGGEQLALVGFMAVHRERLKAIPAPALVEMLKTDELELLFLHMHSMRHFATIGDRLRAAAHPKAADAPADAVTDKPRAAGAPAPRVRTAPVRKALPQKTPPRKAPARKAPAKARK